MPNGHHTARAHHHPGHIHPPATLAASLLRLSAAWRLAMAFGLIVLIWLAVTWAI